MLNKQKIHVLVGIFLSLFFVIMLFFLSPRPIYQPHGLFLPYKQMPKLPVTKPEDISLLQAFPANYKILGSINAELHMINSNFNQRQEIIQYVKSLAASRGANAIVGAIFTSIPTGPQKGMSAYVFRGIAIKVI